MTALNLLWKNEVNNSLTFLDISVIKSGSLLKSKVFRKTAKINSIIPIILLQPQSPWVTTSLYLFIKKTKSHAPIFFHLTIMQ